MSIFIPASYIQRYLTLPKNTLLLSLPWLVQLDGLLIGMSRLAIIESLDQHRYILVLTLETTPQVSNG